MQKEQFHKLLGATISLKRKEQKISQEALGAAIGVSRVQIVNIESGKNGTTVYHYLLLQDILKFDHLIIDAKKARAVIKENEKAKAAAKKNKIQEQIKKLREQITSLSAI